MTTTNERQTAVERAMALNASDEESNLIKQLFPDDVMTLKMKSEIAPGLILPITRAYVIARITGSKVLKKYLDELLSLMISKDRKGRIELMEALTAIRRREEEEY